eukprot:6187205-Pyramimonas_sp.AAC.1
MWWKGPGPYSRGGKWQFRCKVDWSQLVKAQENHPDDVLIKERADQMKSAFGDDWAGGQTSGA